MQSEGRTALRRLIGVLALLAAAGLFVGGAARAVPKAPLPLSPADGSAVGGLPAFAWKAVPGAEEYEFQIAADAGFNSPVLGAARTTSARRTRGPR